LVWRAGVKGRGLSYPGFHNRHCQSALKLINHNFKSNKLDGFSAALQRQLSHNGRISGHVVFFHSTSLIANQGWVGEFSPGNWRYFLRGSAQLAFDMIQPLG
jgi:hypothetical protein